MLFRRVIRIRAEDSPNVDTALRLRESGRDPLGAGQVIPGVLSWAEYLERRATWDERRQCVGLDGRWYEGREVMMYPREWLANSARLAALYESQRVAGPVSGQRPFRREARGMGIDPAEGGDKTMTAVCDELGLLELTGRKTPDTSKIPWEALDTWRRWGLPPEQVMFDRGGGGKQHADVLRAKGYRVRTVSFGESLTLDPRRGLVSVEERMDVREERDTYRMRRDQMYGQLRQLMDPSGPRGGYAIPLTPGPFAELHRQLSLIPLIYDAEGRIALPPKAAKAEGQQSLVKLIGHSPDEADAAVMACHAMLNRKRRAVAGAG